MYAGPGQGQYPKTFQDIKHHCLQNRILFEDRDFPPTNSSLFCSGNGGGFYRNVGTVIWKRPSVRNFIRKFGNFYILLESQSVKYLNN